MAFSQTHNYTLTINQSGGNVDTLVWSDTTNGDLLINLDESIPGGSTDLAVTYALTFANMKAFSCWADRAMTLETENASTPTDTISLVADQPVHWNTNGRDENPLSADVTVIYVTLPAGAASVLHIRAVANA